MLKLNIDFVLIEHDLEKKFQSGNYGDGIIEWNYVPDVVLQTRTYKSIFSSYSKLRNYVQFKILEEENIRIQNNSGKLFVCT